MVTNQNRGKLLLVIIGVLVITNIVLLFFLFQKKNATSGRVDRKTYVANFLKDEIGFDKSQLAAYDTLSDGHREKSRALYERIREQKTAQFRQLVAMDFNDSAINAVSDESSRYQKVIDMNMFGYIKHIRSLCTPAQLPAFDSLFIKVFNRRGEPRKKSGK